MSIFDRILGAITAPLARGLAAEVIASPWMDTDPLTKITLDDLWGITTTQAVSRGNAMRVATVARARNTIATNVGRLPLFTVKDGTRSPIQPALLQQPERGVPLSTTLTWTCDALLFYPCTWWHVLERDTYGWPSWVEWVDRSRAQLDTDGKLTHIDGAKVAAKDIIRFDSPLGSGLLDLGRDTLNRAIKINTAAANAEENPVPSIDLHHEDATPLGDQERADLVEAWRQARIKGGIAYTPKSVTAKAMGQQPEQLLIDGRKAIQLELARHLNVPAWALDVEVSGSVITYQNRQALNAELIDRVLSPYMTAIVDRLSLGDVTPRGWRVKFDTDDLTKPDMLTRFQTYTAGKQGGFIDNQWIADQEGWANVPADSTPAPTDQGDNQ